MSESENAIAELLESSMFASVVLDNDIVRPTESIVADILAHRAEWLRALGGEFYADVQPDPEVKDFVRPHEIWTFDKSGVAS